MKQDKGKSIMKDEVKVAMFDHKPIIKTLISRNKNLTPGRLLKLNYEGKLICARSKKEAKFVFIEYVSKQKLTAIVQVW